MASPPDNDDDGDFSLLLNPYPEVPRAKVSKTMELETSELANMAQSGNAQARPNLVIQLESGRTVELQPGWSQRDEPSSIVVDGMPSVIVAPERAVAPAAIAPAVTARVLATPAGSGLWLVVIAYVLATTALVLAIYERFLR